MEYQKKQCGCGSECLITFEDRAAAFSAGYEQGVAAGRMQSIKDEVDKLGVVAEIAEWLTARTIAASREGTSWADTVAPAPGGADDLG